MQLKCCQDYERGPLKIKLSCTCENPCSTVTFETSLESKSEVDLNRTLTVLLFPPWFFLILLFAPVCVPVAWVGTLSSHQRAPALIMNAGRWSGLGWHTTGGRILSGNYLAMAATRESSLAFRWADDVDGGIKLDTYHSFHVEQGCQILITVSLGESL